MKRLFDLALSFVGLLCAAPILLPVMLLVWLQDGHSPFYVAPRVGKGGRLFRMVKLRSMVVGASSSGVDSTSSSDARITAVGRFIRRYKLDELTQLWNVLKGEMSLVGPRPNVKRETDLYTPVETRLLSVAPGVTDFASIVFADEGDILSGHADADIAYNQLIRPGKSRLGIFYVDHAGFLLDMKLVLWTVGALVSRKRALRAVAGELRRRGAPEDLCSLAERTRPLEPSPPPGSDRLVTARGATA